ncbi:MAG: hypothetical protein AAFP00_04735, partial [Bacteroidota bacterium]
VNDLASRDEYDDYIGRIAGVLSRYVSVEAIAALLNTIEREFMGIYSDTKKRYPAALKLKRLGDLYFK